MKRINIEIKEELHEKLKILATRKKKPMKLLIPKLLEVSLEALEEMEKKKESEEEVSHESEKKTPSLDK